MLRDGSGPDLLSLLKAFPLFERRPLAISRLLVKVWRFGSL